MLAVIDAVASRLSSTASEAVPAAVVAKPSPAAEPEAVARAPDLEVVPEPRVVILTQRAQYELRVTQVKSS